MNQTTDTLFMVTPINFKYNTQTATSNTFQKEDKTSDTQALALQEFNDYVNLLKANNVKVITVKDTITPATPDSIFPNNWFSTHSDGTLIFYPMCAENRRSERKQAFIEEIKSNFIVKKIIDLTYFEKEEKFLEGTGSMVLDRENKIAYACLSPRTNEQVLGEFCEKLGYKKVLFSSFDRNNNLIYHTNVMMSIGSNFVTICLESIKDTKEKENVIKHLKETNKTIIDITYDQLENFVGNMLEIKNSNNDKILVLSKTAYNHLSKEQFNFFNNNYKIISPDISYIEINGGGSARCMIAEIFR